MNLNNEINYISNIISICDNKHLIRKFYIDIIQNNLYMECIKGHIIKRILTNFIKRKNKINCIECTRGDKKEIKKELIIKNEEYQKKLSEIQYKLFHKK